MSPDEHRRGDSVGSARDAVGMKPRPASCSDADEIVRLLGQLGYELSAHEVREQLGTDPEVLVAPGTGQLVGVLAYHTRRPLHRSGRVTSIDAFVVDEHYRSRGVGAVLLETLVQVARASGAELVDLHSNRSRTDARRFYERHGFELTSNYFVRRL